MKVWMLSEAGSKHAINLLPLMIYDDVYDMSKKLYDIYTKKMKKSEKSFNTYYNHPSYSGCNKWEPISFIEFIKRESGYVAYEIIVNVKKKRLKSEQLFEIFGKDERTKKLLTKALLRE